jgi:hypothetical protein
MTHTTAVPGAPVTLQKDGSHDGHYLMPLPPATFIITPCGPTIERKDGIHYVTQKRSTSIKGSIRLNYTIAGGATIVPTEGSSPRITLYFQRAGDDWTARGKYAAYRWYSKQRLAIADGTFDLLIPLEYLSWGPVTASTYNTQAYFEAAKAAPRRVGFVLGGSVGAGHGICTTVGQALFTINSFSVG